MNRITTRIFNTQKQNIRVVLVAVFIIDLNYFYTYSDNPVINDVTIFKIIYYKLKNKK